MNNIIVPLAGPDMIQKDGSLKIYNDFCGGYLLREVLQSRDWIRESGNNFYFSFQSDDKLKSAYESDIIDWFPNSSASYITSSTAGAALSCLATVSMIKDHRLPLIIDLADIHFSVKIDITKIFDDSVDLGAIVPTFQSSNPIYSYLKFTENKFSESQEKKVISQHATAGVYIFRNTSVFLDSLSWFLSSGEKYKKNNNYFCAPLLNGLVKSGMDVKRVEVSSYFDPKLVKADK